MALLSLEFISFSSYSACLAKFSGEVISALDRTSSAGPQFLAGLQAWRTRCNVKRMTRIPVVK